MTLIAWEVRLKRKTIWALVLSDSKVLRFNSLSELLDSVFSEFGMMTKIKIEKD